MKGGSMDYKLKSNLTRKVVAILLMVMIFAAPMAFAANKAEEHPKIKVMTRNLYVGADIFRILSAAQVNPDAIPSAVANFWQTVSETNFPARASSIADEIDRYKPHVIGLQEVATYYMDDPSDFLINPTPDADNEVLSFIDILMTELENRKLRYSIAEYITNADVELPMQVPLPTPHLADLRLVDHDYVLVRKGVTTENSFAANYDTNIYFSFNISGTDAALTVKRGFTVTDVVVDSYPFRFVNSHLETYGGDDNPFTAVQAAQMNELLGFLFGSAYDPAKPIIMVGDFNSDPSDPIDLDNPYSYPYPSVPPYLQAISYYGLVDLRNLRNKPAQFTCCFDEFVSDPFDQLTSRVDHILLFDSPYAISKARILVVGDNPDDMTNNVQPLWPSDHAGVIGQLDFKPVTY
jgi:hypothetical protein